VKTAKRLPSFGLVGYGHFGRFIERTLRPYASCAMYTRSRPRGLERVLREKIIVLCIPVDGLDAMVRFLAPRIPKTTLIVDVSSVKLAPGRIVRKYLPRNPYLSLHPLFGPESAKNGVKGLPVIVCETPKGNKNSACILGLLKNRLMCSLTKMTADEHDRAMAWVQGLSHFISAGLREIELPDLPLRTKSFNHLMEMHHILRNTTDGLLRTIAKQNPHSAAVRKRLLAELVRIDRSLR
jgi:prephenate dehydrogenase